MARRTTPQAQSNMIVGGSETYVAGEQLKEVDVPVETLLGTANGAVSGLLASSVVSAAATIAEHSDGGTRGLGKVVLRNIKGNHLFGVLAGTAAFAFLGGLVRYSRASKHNQWSEKHYAFMEQQHADRVQSERESDTPVKEPSR